MTEPVDPGVKKPATRARTPKAEKPPTLTKLGYDRSTVSSAFQKTLRSGEVEKAVYFGVELARSGGAGYVFKRLMVTAGEDVGLASIETVMRVGQLYAMWKGCVEHSPSSWAVSLHHLVLGIVLVEDARAPVPGCRVLVAEAPKSTQVEDLLTWTTLRLKAGQRLPVEARYEDAHTEAGKRAGRTWADWYRDRHGFCKIALNRFTRLIWKMEPSWCPEEWRDSSPSDLSGGEL